MQQINIRVTNEMKADIEYYCRKKNVNQTELITEALRKMMTKDYVMSYDLLSETYNSVRNIETLLMDNQQDILEAIVNLIRTLGGEVNGK